MDENLKPKPETDNCPDDTNVNYDQAPDDTNVYYGDDAVVEMNKETLDKMNSNDA